MLRRLRDWIRGSRDHLNERPGRAVIVGLALLFGGLAGMPSGEGLYQYTWTDSRFCDDCHVHDYANRAWERSVHAGLTTCHDCHRVPISHYPRNLWLAAFDRPQSQLDIHRPNVEIVICAQCHMAEGLEEVLTGPMSDAVRRKVVKIDDSPLHQLHLEAESRDPGAYRGAGDGTETGHGTRTDDDTAGSEHGEAPTTIGCLDCHGSAEDQAHQFTATARGCVECHDNQRVEGLSAQLIDCRECHFDGFLGSVAGDGE